MSTQICFGLLVMFICPSDQPDAVSDFCEIAGPDIVKLRSMTDAEVDALSRPKLEAIRNLRKAFKRHPCPEPVTGAPTQSLKALKGTPAPSNRMLPERRK